MASGHVNRILKAEHMAAPTNADYVKKVLANSEPSTHGTSRTNELSCRTVALGALRTKMDVGAGQSGRS